MRSHDRSQTIMRVIDSGGPLPHRLGYRILQGCCTGCNRNDLCSEQPHAIDIECLTLRILLAHEYNTFHIQECCCRRRCNSMLTGSGLRDQTGLTHFLRQECLSQDIIDLMGSSMIQVFSLQVNLRSAQLSGQLLRIIQIGRTIRILPE